MPEGSIFLGLGDDVPAFSPEVMRLVSVECIDVALLHLHHLPAALGGHWVHQFHLHLDLNRYNIISAT